MTIYASVGYVSFEMQQKIDVHALFYRLTKQKLVRIVDAPVNVNWMLFEFEGSAGSAIAIPYESVELALRLGVI